MVESSPVAMRSMTAPLFVDSNVLVYRHDRGEPARQQRAAQVLMALWQQRAGRVSTQVLHEFYVVVTHKLTVPISAELARREVRQLHAWDPIVSSPPLRERAWRLQDRFGLSWWDALIVSAAHEAGCGTLLTEDLQDGQDLQGVQVLDPFIHAIPELGLGPPDETA